MNQYLTGALVLSFLVSLLWLGRYQSDTLLINSSASGSLPSMSRRGFDVKSESRIALNQPLNNTQSTIQSDKLQPVFNSDSVEGDRANTKVNKTEPRQPSDLKMPPMPLWHRWQSLLQTGDYQQLPILSSALSRALQQRYDAEVYDEIAELVWQPDTPIAQRALVLDLLSEIATPEALSQLLTFADDGIEPELNLQVLQAITRVADYQWQGRYHDELSPVLLTYWSASKRQDAAFYLAIGSAMAGIGEPVAINSLLQSVSGNDGDENANIEQIKGVKRQAALNVIPKITNPQAVDVLDAKFSQEPIGAPAFEVSGTALTEIGTPESIGKIVDWAQTAPAQGARNLQEWLSTLDDADVMSILDDKGKQTFQSPEIEAVFDQFLAGANSGVSGTAPPVADVSESPSLGPVTADPQASSINPTVAVSEPPSPEPVVVIPQAISVEPTTIVSEPTSLEPDSAAAQVNSTGELENLLSPPIQAK